MSRCDDSGRLLRAIHLDAGRGGSARVLDDLQVGAPPPIVLEARVQGLPAATLSISLTTDLGSLPVAVARASSRAVQI